MAFINDNGEFLISCATSILLWLNVKKKCDEQLKVYILLLSAKGGFNLKIVNIFNCHFQLSLLSFSFKILEEDL